MGPRYMFTGLSGDMSSSVPPGAPCIRPALKRGGVNVDEPADRREEGGLRLRALLLLPLMLLLDDPRPSAPQVIEDACA